MENIRLILLEKNQDEIILFKKRAELFTGVHLVNSIIYHRNIIEEVSSTDADVFAVNVHLPCNISDFVNQLEKKISPSKILLLCEFVQPDLIFNCLVAGAVGYAEKFAAQRKFEEAVKDCFENRCHLPLSIIGLLYAKYMIQEGESIRKKIFQLFSKGFLLAEVIQQTGLTEQEIKREVFLAYQR